MRFTSAKVPSVHVVSDILVSCVAVSRRAFEVTPVAVGGSQISIMPFHNLSMPFCDRLLVVLTPFIMFHEWCWLDATAVAFSILKVIAAQIFHVWIFGLRTRTAHKEVPETWPGHLDCVFYRVH
jgi:hypothetical protein